MCDDDTQDFISNVNVQARFMQTIILTEKILLNFFSILI